MDAATQALHADAGIAQPVLGEVAPALAVTTTYGPEGEGSGFVYGRMAGSQPVRVRAERVIGELEGGLCVLYSSGLAATHAALLHYAPRRVALRGGYHGTHQVAALLGKFASRYGGSIEAVDIDAELRKGDVLWLESPTNPACEVHDVAAHVARARRAGAHVVVDATFAPPPLQRLLTLGADCVMHSATKYIAGHSDALAGALVVRDKAVYEELLTERMVLGCVPGNMESWLILRSLRTLDLRVRRQSDTATRLAAWLSGEGAALGVRRVHHPSLPSHPTHEIARRQMTGGYGGVLSIEVAGDGAAKRLPQLLRLFRAATSLGGVESLIEWRHKWDPKVNPELLRISCGVEAFADLRDDLRRALTELAAAPAARL